ncbi:MAG: carboxypeptidase-like regulatory domain-containing protein, partial [Acidobacteriota bacterium]|nr:carboxypeptidase-like regulatory domain-containing protein [Acidobacteriota bacterium]
LQLQPATAGSLSLSLPPLGVVAGQVFSPDGTPLASGAEVVLTSRASGYSQRVPLLAGGGFSFDYVLLENSPFRCEVFVGAQGRLRARVPEVVLERDGQKVMLDITLAGVGTVSGQVLAQDGSADAGLTLTLVSRSALGGVFNAVSDGGGNYSFSEIPVGPFSLSASDAARLQGVETAGSITRDGEQVVLNLQLAQNVAQLPFILADANRAAYSIQTGGIINDISLRGAPALSIVRDGQVTTLSSGTLGTLSAEGRQLGLSLTGFDGLDVKRRVFVPAEGYAARFVDLISNPGPDPLTVDVMLSIPLPLGYYYSYYYIGIETTSEGRRQPVAGGDKPDRWAVMATGNNYSGYSQGNHVSAVWDGPGARMRASAINFDATRKQLVVTWSALTIPPGEQVGLMHFLSEELDFRSCQTAAERLSTIPPEALAALSQEELSAVVNWNLPANGQSSVEPLPVVRPRTVRGLCLSGDGQTPVPNCTINLTTQNALFPRFYTAYTGSDGLYQFDNIQLADGPYRLSAYRYMSDFSNVLDFTGDAAADALEIVKDIVFEGTSIIRGVLTAQDGTPWASAPVTGAGNATADRDGAFVLAAVPPGLYLITAGYQYGGVVADEFVPVSANQVSTVNLVAPRGGQVRVGVTTALGAAAPNMSVRLMRLEGQTGFYQYTDFNGQAVFNSVPAGRFALVTQQSETGQLTQSLVEIEDGDSLSFNLVLPGTGTVKGVAKSAGGTPLAGAQVILVPPATSDQSLRQYAPAPPQDGPPEGVQPASQSLYVQTDVDGRFRFETAPVGDFALVVRLVSGVGTALGRVGSPGAEAECDVTLPPLGRLRVVARRDGQPLVNRQLSLTLGGRLFAYYSTDADGVFLSPPLPPGTYLVQVQTESGPLAAQGTLSEEGQVLELTPTGVRQGRITGRVLFADGTTQLGISLTATDPVRNTSVYGTTDADGFYTIENVQQTGEVGVRVQVNYYLYGNVTPPDFPPQRTLVLAPEGEDTRADWTLPLGSVAITVGTADGSPPGDRGFRVTLLMPNGNSYRADFKAVGQYLARTLLPLEGAQLRAEFGDSGLVVKADAEVALPEGTTTTSAALTLPQLGRLDVLVVNADGQPNTGARLGLRLQSGSDNPDYNSVDRDGRHTFDAVPYGSFAVRATVYNENEYEYTGVLSSPQQDVLITLPPRATLEVAPAAPATAGSLSLFLDADPDNSQYARLTDGVYRLSVMAPGLFSAAQDSPLLASVGGQIGPGETLHLTLPDAGASGVVYGQATESDGVTPLSNVQFSLFFTGLYRSVGRYVTTNTSGRFVLRNVQPGGVYALLGAGDAGVQGAGATGLLSSGSALRLDLRRGSFGAVQLPTTLNAFRVVQALALQLRRHVEYRTPNDEVLSVNGMSYPGFSAAHPLEDGARLETYPVTMAGAMVERRVFSPPGASWLRYLEILSNPGDTPLELFVRVRGNVVGHASLTSSGGTPAGTADRWIVCDGNALAPPLAFVFGGTGDTGAASQVVFETVERYLS